MPLINCPECGQNISDRACSCPHCGYPLRSQPSAFFPRFRWGYQWKSRIMVGTWPLVHVAIGRDRETGRLLVARGVIAIGQFGIGLITIAQFGVGLLFGFGQFVGAPIAIGQFALGLYFGLGQFASGQTAIGQVAVGEYVRAQAGFGKYVWTSRVKDPLAVEYFTQLLTSVKAFMGW